MCSPWSIRATKEVAGIELRIHEGGWGWPKTLFCWDCSLTPEKFSEEAGEIKKSKDHFGDGYIIVPGCFSVSRFNVADMVRHLHEHSEDISPMLYQILELEMDNDFLRLWWMREREVAFSLTRQLHNMNDNFGIYSKEGYQKAIKDGQKKYPQKPDARDKDLRLVSSAARSQFRALS